MFALNMDQQEIFDKVVTHLAKQKVKSIDPKTKMCLYRGPNKTKCAIGVLIPDNIYSKSWENTLFTDFIKFSDLNDYDQLTTYSLLCSLRDVHDEHKPSDWPIKLRRVALSFELDPSIVKEKFGK